MTHTLLVAAVLFSIGLGFFWRLFREVFHETDTPVHWLAFYFFTGLILCFSAVLFLMQIAR